MLTGSHFLKGIIESYSRIEYEYDNISATELCTSTTSKFNDHSRSRTTTLNE